MGADKDHPYSEAVVANGLVFLSGCLPSASEVPPGASQRELLDAAVKTVERRLKSVGGTLDDVIKLTYYVTDISMREAANEQYLDLWDEPRPARTVIGVAVLPHNEKVEIDAIARQPDGRRLMAQDAASGNTDPNSSPGLTVGILGGMGPAATVDFYAKLVRATPADRDQDHLRVVIWADPTVPDRNAALLEGGTDPTPWLLRGARKLEACGADLIVVPCNQAHAFLPAVAEAIRIPIVSMIEATIQSLRAIPQPVRRVALLAATGTLRTGLYRDQLEEAGLDLLVPTDRQQEAAMAAFRAVKAGDTGATTEDCLTDVASHLVSRGADVLIAGCTEALLALSADRVTIPVIDPAQALAEKIVAIAAMEEKQHGPDVRPVKNVRTPSMDREHA